MDWTKLTTEQKIQRLEAQLQDIATSRNLLNEFERLTKSWIAKVKKASTEKTAKSG